MTNATQQEPPLIPASGTAIEGQGRKCRLERALGKGGFGSAFLATRSVAEVDQEVTVKFLDPHLAASPGEVERFGNEARSLVKLGSANPPPPPSLQRVLDFFTTANGLHCLVLSFAQGQSLNEFTEEFGGIDQASALAIGLGVAEVLEFLEDNKILHCDISPDNLIVDAGWNEEDDGSVKRVTLIDFGIAKESQLTVRDAPPPALNPEWASPELAGRSAVDPRSDIWSLGQVLISALVNRRGPDGRLRRCVVPQRELKPSMVSPGFRYLLLWMIDDDPKKRPPTAAALKRKFLGLLSPRRTVRAALTVAISLVCLASGAAVSWFAWHARPPDHSPASFSPALVARNSEPTLDPVADQSPVFLPEFGVKLEIPKTDYVVGELLRVRVKVSQPCSIRLYWREEGNSAVQFFPNRYIANDKITHEALIPPDGAQYQFRLGPPTGEQRLILEARRDGFADTQPASPGEGPFRSLSEAETQDLLNRSIIVEPASPSVWATATINVHDAK